MRYTSHYYSTTKSFTLVELLIVIGILAIVTAAVVIVLNPAELLKQARDSTRLSDLASIDNAIRNLQTQVDISLGTASTVYVSIPDTSSTCTNLSLPALPTGYTYHCVTADNLRLTNGSGWIPIDFTLSPIQSMASLPIDPTNTTSSGLYYTYIPGGSFELTASLESAKYKLGGGSDKTSTDGGKYTGLVEKGTNLSLLPIDYGDTSLVGYWTFDEGSGTIAYDRSGHNNNGTLTNGPTWQLGSNCIKGGCLSFDGVDDYVDVLDSESLYFGNQGNLSYCFWSKYNFNPSDVNGIAISKTHYISNNYGFWVWFYDSPSSIRINLGENGGYNVESNYGISNINNWNQYCGVVDRITQTQKVYINSIKQTTSQSVLNINNFDTSRNLVFGNDTTHALSRAFNGLIDDIRIYNRALSDAEIQAIYNATK